jgi:hypothetical protein
MSENVDPNSDCRVKERLKTGCIVRIVDGVSTAFANRRCSVLGDPTMIHGKFEIARWFATGAIIKII